MKKLLLSLLLFSTFAAFAQPDTLWKPIGSGTIKDLLCISFGNPSVGYIGGKDRTLLKTTDGGNTWQHIDNVPFTPTHIPNDVVDVQFLSATLGFITVGSFTDPLFLGTVYKTTNGGATWTTVDAGAIAAQRTHFFAENNGIVIGSAFFAGNVISKIVNDTLAAYHYFANTADLFNVSLDFRNSQVGLVGNSKGVVYRTFDGGITWDSVTATNNDAPIHSIKFLDENTILATTDGVLLISYDAGLTWGVDPGTLTFDGPIMRSMVTSSRDSFIAVGSGYTQPELGLIYWYDGDFLQRIQVSQPLHGVALSNENTAFAVGKKGLILTNKIAGGVGTRSIKDIKTGFKVFPNPSKAQFNTQATYQHTLQVYDVLGRKILDRKQPAMQHSFSLVPFAKGNYVAEISVDGQVFSTQLTKD